MWCIFISARRFYAGTALPSCLAAWTGTRLFRREPPNSTGGTCTHALPQPSRVAAGWPVYRSAHVQIPFLFLGGAAKEGLGLCPHFPIAGPPKNKQQGGGCLRVYTQATPPGFERPSPR